MRSRLDNLPIFDARETDVSAEDFNLVSLALKRLGSPIRLELPRLRSLDFILEPDTWIIVDRSLNDVPIVAWLDFKRHDRRGLKDPVHCQRRTYHTHALIIIHKAFDAIHAILGRRLFEMNKGLNEVVELKTLTSRQKNPAGS